MAQSDIDKILAEIKRNKEKSADGVQQQKSTPPKSDTSQQPAEISADSRQALQQFINDDNSREDEELDAEFPVEEYVSKKSEDYIDENFMNFFTQSVIVTKSPEKIGNVNVKRKKTGFFKRRYITDSLSLNIEQLQEEEEESAASPQPQPKDIHQNNTAAKAEKELEKPAEPAPAVRPAKQEEKNTAEEIPAKNNAADTNSISAIKGETDADTLARKILENRRRKMAAQNRAAAPAKEAAVAVAVKEAPPEEDGGIISSIYTSVIEKQAADRLAEDVTAFIPEINRPQDAVQKETIQQIEEPEEEEEPVFEEYIAAGEFFSRPDDESDDILGELADFKQTLTLRMILGGVCCVILAYFNLAAQNGYPMPAFIDPNAQPLIFYLASAVIFAIAFVGFVPTIFSGFTSLKGAPAPDSLVSLCAVLSMVQILTAVVFSSKIDVSETTMFASYTCLALTFNAMGKKIATNTIIKNLSLANVPSGINAGYIINDSETVRRLARTLDEKVPQILVSRKTGSITNFVKAGFSIHKSDYTARKLALISYGVTALCFVLGLIVSKNFATAIFCAAGACALQAPLSQTLVNSVPSALMQKSLEKVGALVNGWRGIDELSKTTHVNFDAKHLFPKGTVILHGIKTFEKERIDLAIIYAASVLINKCEVLKPVFMDVIEGKTDILYPLDGCEYIEGQGYVSWINNNRVIVGNRSLMEKYDIAMPPISLETKFTSQGRKPIYLTVGGKLFGMFVVSYRQDEMVKENLHKLEDKGVNLILSSTDFNIDPQLIEDVYQIPRDCVSVLNQKEAALISQFTAYSRESDACMAHLDSLHSLVSGFCGAESAKGAEAVCSILQCISVVIGAALAVMFTYSQTITGLSMFSMALLGFGFMGLTMIAAFAKRY